MFKLNWVDCALKVEYLSVKWAEDFKLNWVGCALKASIMSEVSWGWPAQMRVSFVLLLKTVDNEAMESYFEKK